MEITGPLIETRAGEPQRGWKRRYLPLRWLLEVLSDANVVPNHFQAGAKQTTCSSNEGTGPPGHRDVNMDTRLSSHDWAGSMSAASPPWSHERGLLHTRIPLHTSGSPCRHWKDEQIWPGEKHSFIKHWLRCLSFLGVVRRFFRRQIKNTTSLFMFRTLHETKHLLLL